MTRSHSASSSLRMWLDGTDRPSSLRQILGDDLAELRLHQRIEPGVWLVLPQQLPVGSQRGVRRHPLPVVLGVGAALLARVCSVEQLVAALAVRAAARPAPRRRVAGSPVGRAGW